MHLNVSIQNASVRTCTFPYSDVSDVPRWIFEGAVVFLRLFLNKVRELVGELRLHHNVVNIRPTWNPY